MNASGEPTTLDLALLYPKKKILCNKSGGRYLDILLTLKGGREVLRTYAQKTKTFPRQLLNFPKKYAKIGPAV